MPELFKVETKKKQCHIDKVDETYKEENILIITILRKKYSII